ncbi:MAG: filamentous hemagglutinin N-terminal domain-containing protein [Brucellaceae bacterium]|nr:filamentous hemagglutinin N-terminal domain-containing protein [Brucellaceae bacterium]
MRKRVRGRANGASRVREFRAAPIAHRAAAPRDCRAWRRDLQSGTAFAALFAIGLIGVVPAVQAQTVLPSGATVTQGTATVSQTGSNSLLIDQTSGSAIINWDSFSIGAGGITHFNNGAGATLNRVTGNLPSQIDGSLTATGSLYLINPAGMVVGTGGMVATGGTFAASTHDVSDADFLDGGDTVFSGNSKAGIINHGTISSAMGDVALIARRVENTGDISAPNGTAALLAGYDILMHETAGPNGKFVVRTGGSDTEVVNSGTINAAEVELRANGGNVLALAGNTKGVVKATGVSKRGGRIFLTAGGGKVQVGGRVTARRRTSSGSAQQSGGDVFINADTVLASGHIDVSGLGAAGGNIDIGGRDIALQGTTLDASGTSGGGQVRVGGAYQGGDFGGLNVADTLLIDGLSVLRADGTDANADGGTVIAWSDDHTVFEGFISARGSGSGDGGFAEVSGK